MILPIVVTVVGIVIDVSFSQRKKALSANNNGNDFNNVDDYGHS
jgi:hypothetical protein